MIHEVDESLRAFITVDIAPGVDVSFEAPNRDWAARRAGPAVNVFLYDIREDLERRDVAHRPIRDEHGRVVGRRQPARLFKLSYLVSAWTQRAEDEHRLLAVLLGRFLRQDHLPTEHLSGSLISAERPVLLSLAMPARPDRSPSDVWSALGGELKPSLDLLVVAPLDPERRYEVGPPVVEAPILGVSSGDGTHHRSLTSDDAGGDEVVAGGEHPGRTLNVRRRPRP